MSFRFSPVSVPSIPLAHILLSRNPNLFVRIGQIEHHLPSNRENVQIAYGELNVHFVAGRH